MSVPVNARARVSLPTLGLEQVSVSESGEAVWQGGAFRAGADGITAARARASYIDLEVGSGAYRFVLTGALTGNLSRQFSNWRPATGHCNLKGAGFCGK